MKQAAEHKPLFVQIAESIEDEIIRGSLGEEEQAPSTNQLAAFLRINPATAAKGINQLADEGILYKKRGIGMFVAGGARAALLEKRRQRFYNDYLKPLLREAENIDITPGEVIRMITERKGDSA
jgi:GntR family transcriptional regulator